MLGTSFLPALAGLGKAALSDAAKQRVKDWLTDTVRVRRAIKRTATAFSTQLPGVQDALMVWVQTEAFRAAMEDLIVGRPLPEHLADDFLSVTGLGFGAASPDVVRDLLAAFFGNIREDLVSARQGLTLVDNRMGELLRQFQEVRADLAAHALPGAMQLNIQRTSTAFLDQIAHTQGWGSGLGYGAEVHVNLELPPAVQNLAARVPAVQEIREYSKDHCLVRDVRRQRFGQNAIGDSDRPRVRRPEGLDSARRIPVGSRPYPGIRARHACSARVGAIHAA